MVSYKKNECNISGDFSRIFNFLGVFQKQNLTVNNFYFGVSLVGGGAFCGSKTRSKL